MVAIALAYRFADGNDGVDLSRSSGRQVRRIEIILAGNPDQRE
jgi:hypothetical protein